MLGKDHILLSLATILIFLIPAFFINFINLSYLATLLIAVSIGSLIPDADCGGKATLYYKYPIIDGFMKKVVGKSVVYIFSFLISKKKINVEYEIKDEHRGIIHSPVGIIISTIFLVIPVLIFMLAFKLFNFYVFLILFFGLLIGQFLHLLQDSCTIRGINWAFPFGTKEIKGKIYTFNKGDIRTKLYSGLLLGLSVLIVIGIAFNKINLNLYILYIILTLVTTLLWTLILLLSKTNEKYWSWTQYG